MIALLRPLSALCLAGLLAACASAPTSSLGELPRTPQASIEQLLQQAAENPQQAVSLRLSAADLAWKQQQPAQALQILDQLPKDQLLPAQQIFAATLEAELGMARNKPKTALRALQHPSFERLDELPVDQQVRSRLIRARTLQANDQPLNAARERIFIAPLLSGEPELDNHEQIWKLLSRLPENQLGTSNDADLDGWLALLKATRQAGTADQQLAAIGQWQQQHPQHPAARQLPQPLQKLEALAGQPLQKIAVLLPESGPLASVARALREGLLAAHYQSSQTGQNPPQLQFYDSNRIGSLDAFYRQAQTDGAQLVIGPLEKPLVKQLGERPQLPLTTLALNYSEGHAAPPAQLFQFGLSPEDEAREVARRAWADGMRNAVALVPRGEWGDRVLAAFRDSWQAAGGSLIGSEHVDQPIELARQIADLLQLKQSESRAKRLQSTIGTPLAALPARRQDIDFIFLAATPQQAQQIKPTLAFQYAGDLPVYATSHLYSGSQNPAELLDMDGILFCDTPWLLDSSLPLRQQVVSQWPQAAGSLGRLYAMGADALRLAPRLSELQALPDNRIDGLSGSLSLGAGQRIHRELPWAQIRSGQIQPLTGDSHR